MYTWRGRIVRTRWWVFLYCCTNLLVQISKCSVFSSCQLHTYKDVNFSSPGMKQRRHQCTWTPELATGIQLLLSTYAKSSSNRKRVSDRMIMTKLTDISPRRFAACAQRTSNCNPNWLCLYLHFVTCLFIGFLLRLLPFSLLFLTSMYPLPFGLQDLLWQSSGLLRLLQCRCHLWNSSIAMLWQKLIMAW